METSMLRKFTKYASLNILGMISLSCYILADTFFVARALGATGLAALNLSISIYSIIHGIGLMIGIGGATRFSILKSRKYNERADLVFSTALKTGVTVGFVLIVIGIFGSRNLALALGANDETLTMTTTYLRTILAFGPFFIANNILLAFVRNDNNPNLAMIAMSVGSFSNIVLDYVLMFSLQLGMFGAAFATSLAPIISIGILLFHFVHKRAPFALLKNQLVWHLIPDILNLGLSAFIIEVSSAIVLITFNLVILGLEGNLGVAAYGIVANLALVGTAIFTGLAQGAQPLASQYYGLETPGAVRKLLKYALFTSALVAGVLYLGTFVYSEGIVGLFNSEGNPAIAHMAETGLRIYFLGFFAVGVNIVSTTFLSATERTRVAFIISISRGVVIMVPLVLILSRLWNMTGVWLSFVFTELIVMLLAVYMWQRNTMRPRAQ